MWGYSLGHSLDAWAAAFSVSRRTWRLGAARVSYLSADEKSRAVAKASQLA